MAELKTQPTEKSVEYFLDESCEGQRLLDCQQLVDIMREITGRAPQMWGSSIIGFGSYHYVYSSGKEADWLAVGFSPRKTAITLYIMTGFGDYMDESDETKDLMSRLGKYKTGKSCLYVKQLSDIDLEVLKELIRRSLEILRERYETDLG